MPPSITRKEDRFQSYHSGYLEVAPSLDALCRKHISLSIIAEEIKKSSIRDGFRNPAYTARRFVDASRDKPERRPLSVLSLRLPRSRVFARLSM